MHKVELKELKIKGKVLRSGNRPLVCVPLMGGTDEQLIEHLEKIIQESQETNIDIVEFRGDFYNDIQDFDILEKILIKVRIALQEKILLFTIRSPKEGGEKRDYSIKSIDEINSFVIDKGLADMVDVELYSVDECNQNQGAEGALNDDQATVAQPAIIKLAKERQVKIIMSNHDFEKTPPKEEIISRLVRMQELGADVAKIAVMPNSDEDVKALLAATLDVNMKHGATPVVTMSMGEMGVSSRLFGEMFGSAFTFGAVGEVSAPGQIQVKDLNRMLDMIHDNSV